MNFGALDWAITIVYLAGSVALGLRAKKHADNLAGYMVAGRRVNVALGIAAFVATEIGTVTFVYFGEIGYVAGFSGFIIGLVGSSYAFQQVTIFPERLFDVDISVLMVIMVVIGGSGTVLGPLLGAVALQFLSEYLREHFTDLHIFILGAIIILAVLLLPQGAVNYVREARRTREWSLLANVRRYRL